MMLVSKLPNWGWPEDNSKIDPTAAISDTQEAPKNRALLKVNGITVFLPYATGLTACGEKPNLFSS